MIRYQLLVKGEVKAEGERILDLEESARLYAYDGWYINDVVHGELLHGEALKMIGLTIMAEEVAKRKPPKPLGKLKQLQLQVDMLRRLLMKNEQQLQEVG